MVKNMKGQENERKYEKTVRKGEEFVKPGTR
jgi:hypothetical protein